MSFAASLVVDFFVAMGIVIGGSLLGGVGASLMHAPPMAVMVNLAEQLKIWAMVSTLGGTMDTLKVIESGVLTRELAPVGRQITFLIAAFIGCEVGAFIIRWLAGEGGSS
ncbi:YtrH family sporulation protein [Alicyclobacillus sp.]|uniref:YtrH family sporulation protein n=1 Tax=Alicyclobacillus sp. TaxID=61169 RepID=UPI0025BF7085|nr:YtrH family sporulation protein [Alicyclobacillus sp.]MCL6515736.1 YtrH family sporulation protein [Alicyclobacillus sp.]